MLLDVIDKSSNVLNTAPLNETLAEATSLLVNDQSFIFQDRLKCLISSQRFR